jgi:hypothetical protein
VAHTVVVGGACDAKAANVIKAAHDAAELAHRMLKVRRADAL